MSGEHEALRRALGRVGAWTFTFDELLPDGSPPTCARSRRWATRRSGSPRAAAPTTSSPTSGGRSGRASASPSRADRATSLLASQRCCSRRRFLGEANGGRLVLGIGVGHEYSTERRGVEWIAARAHASLPRRDGDATSPWRPAHACSPRSGTACCALARPARSARTPTSCPVAHTAHARDVLGAEPVLAVEVGVMPGVDDEATARAWAREWAVGLPELPNDANNW